MKTERSRVASGLMLAILASSCGGHGSSESKSATGIENAPEEPIAGASEFVIPEGELLAIEKAALSGDAEAAYRLGMHFVNMSREDVRSRQAYQWFALAADKAHAGALRAVALELKYERPSPAECPRIARWRDLSVELSRRGSTSESASENTAMFEETLAVVCKGKTTPEN